MKTTSKTIKRARLILMAVLVLSILSIGVHPQPASATQGRRPIPVNCGDVINVPGNYILTGNLNCMGTGVTITADDVDFNLNGFTISGDGTGGGILVDAPVDVYIHGGTVTGFGAGMLILGSSFGADAPQPFDLLVNGMTITGSDFGIVVSNGAFGQFNGNTITGNGTGVLVEGVFNQFNGNTITGNTGVGVLMDGSSFNEFNSNIVTDNGGGGFDLLRGLSRSESNVIKSNDISDNGNFGVRLFGGHIDDNTVRGNTVNGNPVGIHILSGSGFNTIQENTALGNTTFDLKDDNADCGTNTWRSNIFGTANQGCIQ